LVVPDACWHWLTSSTCAARIFIGKEVSEGEIKEGGVVLLAVGGIAASHWSIAGNRSSAIAEALELPTGHLKGVEVGRVLGVFDAGDELGSGVAEIDEVDVLQS
jgi:hypothetical protein